MPKHSIDVAGLYYGRERVAKRVEKKTELGGLRGKEFGSSTESKSVCL